MSSHAPSCDLLYESALSLGGRLVERRDRDLVPVALRLMDRGLPVDPPTSDLADPVVSALDGVAVPLPWPRHLDEVFRGVPEPVFVWISSCRCRRAVSVDPARVPSMSAAALVDAVVLSPEASLVLFLDHEEVVITGGVGGGTWAVGRRW